MAAVRGLAPIVSPHARILILGSMPGVLALKNQEYYAHPRNQFWKIVAALAGVAAPVSYVAKKALLRRERISVWDVFASCERRAASDASIRQACVNDIPKFLKKNSRIRLILLNGKTAAEAFHKVFEKSAQVSYAYVPSSAATNARLSLSGKIALWRKAMHRKS